MDILYKPFSLHSYKRKNQDRSIGSRWGHSRRVWNQNVVSPWPRSIQHSFHFYLMPRTSYDGRYAWRNFHLPKSSRRFSISASKINKGVEKVEEEPAKVNKKKGTIAGAVALIIGTSIGSGILALPQKTSPAGLLPSSITLTVCWAFLVIEALLLVEINVRLMKKRRIKVREDELEVISIRTMAQETLGDWGGVFATVIYVFLSYSSMIAYNSKSGEIINHLVNIPYSVSGFLFPVMFAVLISFGGTRATDQVNQWLTASMIGLLLAIEILGVVLGGWSGLDGSGDWEKVPPAIPVIIFSLVYHDLAPVLCAYLGGDLQRIRIAVLLGSIVPLLALLVWDAIALRLSSPAYQVVDPIELFISMRWNGASFMIETFSLLAVGTSIIGTLLGFSEFFKEQIGSFSRNSLSIKKQKEQFGLRKWWGENKVNFTAMAMVIAPSLIVSTTVPNTFSSATDIAGGYCMTMLYGVLPPAMAWSMYNKNRETKDKTDDKVISTARPALIGIGLIASAIVLEQIFQDLSSLHL